MKKTLSLSVFFSLVLLICTGMLLSSSTEAPPPAAKKYKMSKKVDAIVQSHCYGCHSEKGRSDKAKEKLMWDDLGGLGAAALKDKMEMIQGVLEKEAMPPKRFVESNPDKKLTEKQTKTLEKWAMKYTK